MGHLWLCRAQYPCPWKPNGEPSNFYADGYAYYTISNNMGYEGDLELAMVPESFRTDVLKESLDDNSVLVESANVGDGELCPAL